MNKAKFTLYILVLTMMSVSFALVTTYLYGSWQHDRYWDGTMGRVNQIETAVYEKLLRANIVEQYHGDDFSKFNDVFAPLNGKLLIRLLDERGKTLFSNLYGDRQLGELILKSEFSIGPKKFTVEFIRYNPPDWNHVFFRWILHPSDWKKIKYDRITMPFIFFSVIWLLFFVSASWWYRAKHLSRDVLDVLNSLDESK
jgi:hypothetical protein